MCPAKTPQAVLPPETLRRIFELSTDLTNRSNALVCKDWCEEALSVVWSNVDAHRLFSLLAPMKLQESEVSKDSPALIRGTSLVTSKTGTGGIFMASAIASLRDPLVPRPGYTPRPDIPVICLRRNRSRAPSCTFSAEPRGFIQPPVRHVRVPALRACVSADARSSPRVRRKERRVARIADAQHRALHMRYPLRPLLV